MIPKIFIVNEENRWSQTIIKGYKIFYSGYIYNYDLRIFLSKFINKIKKNHNNTDRIFKDFKLEGHFAIVIKKQNFYMQSQIMCLQYQFFIMRIKKI